MPMHTLGNQNIDKSEQLLNQAYTEITSLDDYLDENSNAVFSALFNRNGYALILFKRNNFNEAKS